MKVEERLRAYPQHFEVAVLGCAVNGPGEAGDADFGIAGGRDVGFVYAHGRVLKKVSSDILIDELFFEIDKWIAEGMHRPKRLKMAKPAALAMAEASLIPLDELGCGRWLPGHHSSSLPTLREDPADAEAVSHKLLVRGGFVRQVSAGLWSYLPLGWRIHRKVEQIIREEMDAIGGQEFLCPLLTPVELWEATGRDKIPEIFHVTDRTGRRFILPLTHEETFTFHAREIRSYKELPQLWYHFSVKDRDEPRPRGGLLRVREFIMKDAYSFDRDEEGVGRELRAEPRGVPPDLRALRRRGARRPGGERDHGRQADVRLPRAVGLGREHARPLRARRLRGRRGDRAAASRARPSSREPLGAPEEVETPGVTTCEALAEFLGVDLAATSKAMPVTKDDGTVVLALLRGDDRLSESKLLSVLGGDSRPVDRRGDPRRVRRLRRLARPGRVRRGGARRRDAARGRSSSPARTATAGTSRGVEAGRDYQPRSPTSASRSRATAAPSAAARSRSRPRSRSGTSSTSATKYCVAARGDVPRRGWPGEAAPRRKLRNRPGTR